MKTLFKTENAELIYDEEKNTLYQRWIGFSGLEPFMEAIDKAVEISEQYKVDYILSDTREQAVVKKEGTDYAASVMPKLVKKGLKKMAFLMPESIFTKISVQSFTKESHSDIIKHFIDEKEALDWLYS